MLFTEPQQRFFFCLEQKYSQKILFCLFLQHLKSSTETEIQAPTLATGCAPKARPEENCWNAEMIERPDVLDMTQHTEIFLGIFFSYYISDGATMTFSY